ncbi:MAG: lytic transglycosylase domain-containing protein [Oligoflexia bacterium]|nr:lytic transglycosylase domain-containing protein [Oligoflexia bacterium]
MFFSRALFLFFPVLGFLWAMPCDSAPPADPVLESPGPESRLRKNVDFWVRIYSEYTTQQGVIHDSKYVDRVYEVVASSAGRAAKRKWRDVLLSLHRKEGDPARLDPAKLTEDEKRVVALFADIHEPNKYLNAAHRKRLRFQLGQKDSFLQGLKSSGRYLAEMEEIFRREGVPVELTRLPFVESSFNFQARSKVGASGIWQFMRSTGRLFLRVDEAVDERNDPIRATEAAAKLLKLNYESLGRWPLAVTAYNHGRKGMMRAVRSVGSDDINELVGNYRGRTFGFASSNFYAELLAAVEVERNSERYFGKLEREAPQGSFEVRIPDFIGFKDLRRFLKLDEDALMALNPGLTDAVLEGKLLIPAGYRLRVPSGRQLAGADAGGAARVFLAGYEKIPALYKRRAQLQLRGQGASKYVRRGKK